PPGRRSGRRRCGDCGSGGRSCTMAARLLWTTRSGGTSRRGPAAGSGTPARRRESGKRCWRSSARCDMALLIERMFAAGFLVAAVSHLLWPRLWGELFYDLLQSRYAPLVVAVYTLPLGLLIVVGHNLWA